MPLISRDLALYTPDPMPKTSYGQFLLHIIIYDVTVLSYRSKSVKGVVLSPRWNISQWLWCGRNIMSYEYRNNIIIWIWILPSIEWWIRWIRTEDNHTSDDKIRASALKRCSFYWLRFGVCFCIHSIRACRKHRYARRLGVMFQISLKMKQNIRESITKRYFTYGICNSYPNSDCGMQEKTYMFVWFSAFCSSNDAKDFGCIIQHVQSEKACREFLSEELKSFTSLQQEYVN